MNRLRQRTGHVALLLLGGAIGAVAALEAARILELRLAQEALRLYAEHNLHVGETSSVEAVNAATQFSNDGMGFCSDDEIVAMRRVVYDAAFVKDLGRERNGLLYCTSGIGRLKLPLPMPAPALAYFSANRGTQVEIYPDHALALAPNSHGIIVEMRGVTVVLNPALFASLDNPPMRVAGLIRDTQHEEFAYVFGRPAPLSTQEILAGHMLQRSGSYYQPLCSSAFGVCIVASETRADMVGVHRGYFIKFPATSIVFTIIGGLVGISVACCILLFIHRQRSFERRLRRAVRTHQIMCAYQPVVDLATHAIVGAEALARWTDESGEAVPPDVFIPVAEEKGFISDITRQIVNRVILDMGSLIATGNFHVTVNLSSHDLSDRSLLDSLEQTLKRNWIPERAVGFEITERATALHSDGQAGIARLRASGHPIYLDDFGTGYSSLSYLHDLHADAIKIDRAFTRTVGTEAVTASVVPHILEMALKLGLGVVVEGIETAEQADYFRSAFPGALGQGWLFGRPVAAQEFKVQLRMRSQPSAQGPVASNPASLADEPEG